MRRYLSQGKQVISLCLGGQLIANALGARVSPHQECFSLPDHFNVLQWHSESFEIATGAVHLAENQACCNQKYQLRANVLGFQFHPEMTPESLTLFLDNEAELLQFSGT